MAIGFDRTLLAVIRQMWQGSIWTYSAIAFGAAVQIGVTSATARLLDPTAFGLVAMANVVVRLGAYVARMGLPQALIQRQHVDDDEVRAAFASSTLLGVAVAGVVAASAPVAGVFFQSDVVVPVLRWLSLTFVLSGLGATAQALLRRRLHFRATGFIEVMSYALGFGLPATVLAASGFGVWSLVVATLGQRLVASALAYTFVLHGVRPPLRARAYSRLFGFGSKVSIISFLEYIGLTLDSALIGRFGSAAQLGLYNRARACSH